MLRAVTALVLLAGALVCPAVWGSDYFVSPQGDDGNPGTAGQPWKTLARPNAAAVSGDTVTFAPGEYEGAVSPQNSGRPGAPITLRSARPLAAVLRGVKGGPAVSLIQKQHVVLEGFSIHPADGWWAAIRECEGITLRGCRMEEARGSYTAFHVTQSKGTRLLGNVFTRQVSLRKGLILNGDMLTVDHSDRTVVEGNDFSKAGHGPATWLLTTNDVIRSNLFHAEWGRNFSLFNCSPVLFEHNVAIENYHGSASADTGSKILTIDGIVRRNLLARNWGYVIHSFGYTYGQFPPWVLTGTRIYHNTFANNASFAWGISSATRDGSGIRGNVWKNNVFSRHTPASPARTFLISGVIGDDNLWANNLIWGGRAGAETIWRWDAGARGQLALPLERAEKQFQSEWRGNLDADPLFAE